MQAQINNQASFIQLPGLINEHFLIEMDKLLENASFIDGQATATLGAKMVKKNLQANPAQQDLMQHLQYYILQAFNQSALFQNAALPKQIYAPIFSRYSPGMYYGWHVDSPVMGHPAVRTDIAMTIFLEDPDKYEGGELEIQTETGPVKIKLNKGDAVCYPCHYLHRVCEVTSGTRKVAVTWIQSMVKSPEQRNILFKLKELHTRMFEKDAQSPEANELLQTYSNLIRLWAEI